MAKKTAKKVDLSKMSQSQLQKRVQDLRALLLEQNQQLRAGSQTNIRLLKGTRRKIAQTLTKIREKELTQEGEAK